MEDKHFSRLLKLIPAIIAILFVLTLFIWLTIGIKEILSPTVLTVILITILIPFKEENRTIRILIGAIIFLYMAWFVSLIATTLVPFAIALILAYIFDPVVTFLEKKGWSRPKGALFLIASLLLGFIILLLFVIPALTGEITGFIKQIPQIQAKIIEIFNMLKNLKGANVPEQFRWIQKIAEYEIPPEFQNLAQSLIKKLEETIPQVANKAWSFLAGAFSGILQFVLSLLSLIIIPVLTFYMLKEMNNIRNFAIDLVPAGKRDFVISICHDINIALSNFLRGQLLIASIVGILTAIGLFFIGIKFSLLIGLLAGISNVVPYLGGIVTVSTAILMALFTEHPIVSIILVIALSSGISFLENSFLSPKILGETLELNPLLIMLAILIGGQLYSFWGMLLAIPFTCVLKVLFDRWYKHYKDEEKIDTSKESSGDIKKTEEKPQDIKKEPIASEVNNTEDVSREPKKSSDIKKEDLSREMKKDEDGKQNEMRDA
ncbi:MAG: AI-2E family transporter [Candidatus Eremiobacterota bacterium]